MGIGSPLAFFPHRIDVSSAIDGRLTTPLSQPGVFLSATAALPAKGDSSGYEFDWSLTSCHPRRSTHLGRRIPPSMNTQTSGFRDFLSVAGMLAISWIQSPCGISQCEF
jgi:hypothetical protein